MPSSAPAQRLRASSGVVPSSFATVQVGRPLKFSLPCLSNSKTSVFSAGGASPFTVLIRTMLLKVAGSVPCSGNARGWNSAVALTLRLPIWVVTA